MKKVLFLSPFPPPYGGIATLTKVLFEKGLPDPYFATVVDTKAIGDKTDSRFKRIWNEVYRESRIIIKLMGHLIFKRPSVVHLNCSVSPVGVNRDLVCVLLSRLFGVHVLTHYHGNLGDYNVREKYPVSNFSLKNLIRFTSVNIYSNIPSLRFASTELGLNLNPKTNYILPNYASDKIWKYKHVPQDKSRIRCAFIGTLCKAKGTDLIVELAKAMPEFDFELVGRVMPDVETVLTQNSPKNLKLCGLMEQLEVYNYLQTVDILLFPSLTEGFPLSMVEAMSVGLPVICTNVGSLPEMVDDGLGGYVVQPGDLEAFKRSILSLVNFEVRQKAAAYNYLKAKNEYSFDSVAKRLVNSYNQVS